MMVFDIHCIKQTKNTPNYPHFSVRKCGMTDIIINLTIFFHPKMLLPVYERSQGLLIGLKM